VAEVMNRLERWNSVVFNNMKFTFARDYYDFSFKDSGKMGFANDSGIQIRDNDLSVSYYDKTHHFLSLPNANVYGSKDILKVHANGWANNEININTFINESILITKVWLK
jgi:hypothetical protein